MPNCLDRYFERGNQIRLETFQFCRLIEKMINCRTIDAVTDGPM